MNKIVNNFLLTGDRFIPELHLKQLRFTYSACGPFTKHSERIKKFKGTRDLNYVYKNESDKVCFAHDDVYVDSKDLAVKTVLKDEAN